MGTILAIHNETIERVLKGVSRQYFVGNLKKPQKLDFIRDRRLEIGITSYDTYSTEPVHYHTEATEYQYVISGWTQYMDVDTGKVYEFKRGDFYCIEKYTTYAQKSKKGTRILFIKTPSVNDKNIVVPSPEIKKWYEEGLHTVRRDYAHEPIMPDANSIQPAAAVAIVHDRNLLMLKRRDNEKWTLPGGTLELEESLPHCAVREMEEETGLHVKLVDVIGTYTDPNIRIEYSDGEVRREFTIVYYGTTTDHEINIDDESSLYAWIPLTDLENYPMAESQSRRVLDVVEYLKMGKKSME